MKHACLEFRRLLQQEDCRFEATQWLYSETIVYIERMIKLRKKEEKQKEERERGQKEGRRRRKGWKGEWKEGGRKERGKSGRMEGEVGFAGIP